MNQNILNRIKSNYAMIAAILVGVGLAYYGVMQVNGPHNVTPDANTPIIGGKVLYAGDDFISDRVINLPEDGMKWYTLIVYSDARATPGTIDEVVKRNFATEPRLQSLLRQTRLYETHAQSQMYQERYRQHYGDVFPLVVLQREDGFVCFESRGSQLNVSGSVLASGIARKINDCKPRPKPTPVPVTPTPNVPPNITPDVPDDGIPFWAWAFPILAGFGGAAFQWRRSDKAVV